MKKLLTSLTMIGGATMAAFAQGPLPDGYYCWEACAIICIPYTSICWETLTVICNF